MGGLLWRTAHYVKLVLDFTVKSHELQRHKQKNKKISAYLSPGTSERREQAHSMHRTTSGNPKPVQERQCFLGCVLTSIPEPKPGQNTANLLLRKMFHATRQEGHHDSLGIFYLGNRWISVSARIQTLWIWLHNSDQKSRRYFYLKKNLGTGQESLTRPPSTATDVMITSITRHLISNDPREARKVCFNPKRSRGLRILITANQIDAVMVHLQSQLFWTKTHHGNVSLSLRMFPERFHRGHTHPEYGWHHLRSWDLRLNEMKKVGWSLTLPLLCFLGAEAMWPAASHSPHHGVSPRWIVSPQTMSQNKPFLKLLLSDNEKEHWFRAGPVSVTISQNSLPLVCQSNLQHFFMLFHTTLKNIYILSTDWVLRIFVFCIAHSLIRIKIGGDYLERMWPASSVNLLGSSSFPQRIPTIDLQ